MPNYWKSWRAKTSFAWCRNEPCRTSAAACASGSVEAMKLDLRSDRNESLAGARRGIEPARTGFDGEIRRAMNLERQRLILKERIDGPANVGTVGVRVIVAAEYAAPLHLREPRLQIAPNRGIGAIGVEKDEIDRAVLE